MMFFSKQMVFFGVALFFVIPFIVSAQASDSFTVRQLYGNDTEAPTTPSPFTVTPLSTTQIDIEWGASTDNTSIAGYQLFRDSVQIATTTLLSYSDTGLTPSTTYSYFVRAFDIFSNLSTSTASVSTSTYATPVVPVDPVATSSSPQSSVLPPRMASIDIDSGTESARIVFHAMQPVIYTLRFGVTDALTGGFVQSDLFKKEHSTILTGLIPHTTYFFELYGTDRFGREALLEKGTFTTLSRYELPPTPNVSFFTAVPLNQSVLLEWGNPATDSFAYVRVLRNHYYYPQYPTDGIVIYEGTAESFYDELAFSTYERQFYSVFAYNIDGTPSSGAIAVAIKNQVDTPAPGHVTTDNNAATSTANALPREPFRLTFADITVIQYDVLIPATAETILLNTVTPFMIRVPAAMLPGTTKTIIVSWQHPFDTAKKTSYLMKRNEDGTFFEAIAAPILDAGLYPLKLAVFDMGTNELGFVSGVLEVVQSEESEVVAPPVTYVATIYVIIGGIIGLLSILGIWWLLLLLVRLLFRGRKN